jgi:hypothetical protein
VLDIRPGEPQVRLAELLLDAQQVELRRPPVVAVPKVEPDQARAEGALLQEVEARGALHVGERLGRRACSHLNISRLTSAHLNCRTSSSRWCRTTRYRFTSSPLMSFSTSVSDGSFRKKSAAAPANGST